MAKAELGIRFEADFFYPVSDRVEVVDISILLMNALSNAILAAESSEASFVKVHSFLHRGTYLIEVRNSFDGVLDFQTESGFPETKKEKREEHGYGLFNIKRVAERYGGAVTFMQEGREVILTVMLLLL
ncbi:MAG: sensor histidine kinase [Lachnospiraceae bacterium]|nr:sensor histidine kinase [Lachnospiraceae bacterium]